MQASRRPSAASLKLTLLFAAVLVPPAVALIWLGATLLDLDRVMLAERGEERRSASTEILTRALVQSMGETDRWLVGDHLPADVVRVTRTSAGETVFPVDRVLWTPSSPMGLAVPSAPFEDAERLEFARTGDRGLSRYTALAASPDPTLRAGALIRLARVHRGLGRTAAALQAYRQLAAIANVVADGTPVDLIGRRMVCDTLHAAGRRAELVQEAEALGTDLLGGRWQLDRPAWELAAKDLETWTGSFDAGRDRRHRSQAIEWVVGARRTLPASGWRVAVFDEVALTIRWLANGDEFRAVVIGPGAVDGWLRAALSRELPAPVSAAILTDSGALIAGAKPSVVGRTLTVTSSESSLPWTLLVGPTNEPLVDHALETRRQLLAAGIGALGLLILGSSYLLWRAVRGELAVARLQTDFVAAVSHEFRTPLTSLRHITELLQETDELPPGRRQSLYSVLGQSTERLHRLVESLLDFARMEDGRRPWHLRPVDAAALVADTVTAFRREHPDREIGLDVPPGEPSVQADADALTHALWNLLDNAIKYSPDGGPIRVTMREVPGGLSIEVSDRGVGIPASEQRDIFGRFVRGRSAAEQGVPGTGLGLALVTHIVSAHGGRIDLQSQEGEGSTFTIVLPRPATGAALADAQAAGTANARSTS